jgi:hypothetical protein
MFLAYSRSDATTLTFDKRANVTFFTAKGGEAARLAPARDVLSRTFTRVATVPAWYSYRAGRHGDASANLPAHSFSRAACQK